MQLTRNKLSFSDASVAEMSTFRDNDTTIVPRSKSSDVLKRDLLSTEVKRSSSHFNSLKQWGKNRLRMINKLSGTGDDTSRNSFRAKQNSNDIDDFNVLEAINKRQKKINEKDRRLSHERKPSYSSSERSLNTTSSLTTTTTTTVQLTSPTVNVSVKMREQTAVIRRQRRTGATAGKDEPHSSSGNWSASSESGRTSIGSEITTTTTHPKSSASSTSLSHHTHHSSSGPPSSIISRRRFLNTSASSSITSEGTATPELQMFDGLHDEGETSSVYSCDTEGYYTSFHVDSGLKTLKEEESLTPMQSSMALSSTNSFESSGNQTVISPENEYELFGKGSTTTSSSAGTVCTAVLSMYDADRSGPSVPERKSSLCKLNRSSSSTSSGTLERSYSTSTVGSTLEKSGTIKRNGVLLQKEVAALVHQHQQETIIARIESPDSGNNTSSSPVDSNSSPTNQNARLYSEFECSESSDLECVERTERIRVKTTINTSRIPSIVAITPTPSDDESVIRKQTSNEQEIKIKDNILNVNKDTGYAIVVGNDRNQNEIKISRKTSPLIPLNNMLDKLRGVLHPLKKSPNKENNNNLLPSTKSDCNNDEYVTISEVQTPKRQMPNGIYYSSDVLKKNLATVLSGNINEETEYVSLNELPCNVRSESNLLAISENNSDEKIDMKSGGDENVNKNRGEVVRMDAHGKPIFDSNSLKRKKGAITTFSPGPCVKDIYDAITTTTSTKANSSSSLNLENHNRKQPITSTESKLTGSSASVYRRTANTVRPVVSQREKIVNCDIVTEKNNNNKSIQKSVTKSVPVTTADEKEKSEPVTQMTTSNSANHLMRPNGTLSLNLNSVSSKVLATGTIRGAYVNIQDAAPLRNGPPVYSPPSPSRAATIFAPQEQQQPTSLDEGKSDSFSDIVSKFAPKIVDFTPKMSAKNPRNNNNSSSSKGNDEEEEKKSSENIDPNMMRAHIKRSNSYRMAAIYADPNDLSKSKESLNGNVNNSRVNVRKSFIDSDDEPYMNISKTVTRSFEKLIEEFSKSTSAIISTDLMLNESLKSNDIKSLNRYSLEPPAPIDLNEYMTDSSFDDVMENSIRPIPLHIPSPSKVTLPADSQCHKARVLTNFDTEIW